ncbi:MAG: M20/M25/M40 family metallo-hydrolase, partial [Candidatus Promineifilaceae bacterium]|nr:M20/M25/M40 family metallo-hydrolase [Candidatus Promineifilaceae bacterium]
MKGSTADKLRAYLRAHRDEMLAFLEALVRAESPSTVPESQTLPLNLMSESLQTLGFQVQRVPGVKTGGGLLGRWPVGDQGEPGQLLLGHCDTVWPLGTLEEMPFVVEGNVARGPGIYDMKAGLTQLIFALQALVVLDLHPDRSVVV